jgi:transposase, IS30 family
MICDLHRVGETVRAIAAELGRSRSTIRRDLRRNVDTRGRYRPAGAHRMAVARRSRPRPRRLLLDDELREVVQARLTARRSPEQVAHHLREQYPEQPGRQLVTESVDQAVYDPACGLTRERAVLRTGRRRRKRHRRPDGRRHGQLARDVMTMIDQRPATHPVMTATRAITSPLTFPDDIQARAEIFRKCPTPAR